MTRSKMEARPNEGRHIHNIINRTTCAKHNATEGQPCFTITYDAAIYGQGFAICGARVLRAGFNGRVNPSSLNRKAR